MAIIDAASLFSGHREHSFDAVDCREPPALLARCARERLVVSQGRAHDMALISTARPSVSSPLRDKPIGHLRR